MLHQEATGRENLPVSQELFVFIFIFLILLFYFADDYELENFVARNSQRMSLRLYNKRRPMDPLPFSASPANKRSACSS